MYVNEEDAVMRLHWKAKVKMNTIGRKKNAYLWRMICSLDAVVMHLGSDLSFPLLLYLQEMIQSKEKER